MLLVQVLRNWSTNSLFYETQRHNIMLTKSHYWTVSQFRPNQSIASEPSVQYNAHFPLPASYQKVFRSLGHYGIISVQSMPPFEEQGC